MESLISSTGQPWRHVGVVLLTLVACCSFVLSGSATDLAPIVSVGESNSPLQREEVLDLLNADSADQVVTVTVDETVQAMGSVFDMAGIDSAYSSTALTCGADGSGIRVGTRNIEAIPPELYAVALLTAGVTDLDLMVAAPRDALALGMTAMTGVFKTWDLATCAGTGLDPVRRQLALEQLALISDIGGTPDGIRQTTRVVLSAQQDVMGENPSTGQLETIVTSRSADLGADLPAEDLAAIVTFLGDLSEARIDWGPFSAGWTMQVTDDGAGVSLTANVDATTSDVRTTPIPGVGGVTGPIAPAASPAVRASPIAMTPPQATSGVTPTTVVVDESRATTMGAVLDHGREAGRWWPLAVVGVALLLGIGARRQPSERAQTWYVSRSRVFWLGRTLRRPPIIQGRRRPRRMVIITKR